MIKQISRAVKCLHMNKINYFSYDKWQAKLVTALKYYDNLEFAHNNSLGVVVENLSNFTIFITSLAYIY